MSANASQAMAQGFDAARRLIRRLEIPNRAVQRFAAEALIEADARVQERINRGDAGPLDDREPECEADR